MLEQSMDELKRAKLDLPAPALPVEFPKKPFGVFEEPNFEAKVCFESSQLLIAQLNPRTHSNRFAITGGHQEIHLQRYGKSCHRSGYFEA